MRNARMGISDKTFSNLTTGRLALRAPNERDIPAWFARATDREAASLAGDPIPEHMAAGMEWLARSRRQLAEGRRFQWSIDLSGVADAIGTISLSFSATDSKSAELGFVLARAYWGRGLATEAAREVLRYAFEGLALEEVRAEAVERNLASYRILVNLGFEQIESFVDVFDGESCGRFRRIATQGR